MCNRPPVSTHKAFPCCGRCTRNHLSIVGVIYNWSNGLQVFTQISPNAVNFMVWQFKTCFSRLVSLPDCSKCSKCLTEISEGFVIAQQTDLAAPTKKMVSPCAPCASLCYLCYLCLFVLSVAILHSLAIPLLQCIAMEAMEWIGSFLPFQQKRFPNTIMTKLLL